MESGKSIKILGGKKFLNSPVNLFPYIKSFRISMSSNESFLDKKGNVNPLKLTTTLGEFYLAGWQYFRALGQVFDPGVDMYSPNLDSSKTKTWEIYQVLKDAYEGMEFDTGVQPAGIPGIKN